MNILIIGGYGVFGSRLARLLVKDGLHVCVAGRNLTAAKALAADVGCSARKFDRTGDLDVLAGYDVVIDAAGPFHAYGDDPYRLPKAAIAQDTHYLDLSDNAAFCVGIKVLDAAATKAGLCVLSGLSTVPAISAAVVTELAGADRPLAIEAAISPGNRAPRGMAVMQSILAQAGRPFSVWRGGAWSVQYGWSKPRSYALPDGSLRQTWQIEVPDNQLFPKHFNTDSLQFRAGLELGVMRYGLAAFAQVQRVLNVPVTPGLVRLFKWMADLLSWFGTDRGGMFVKVTTQTEHRIWSLLAQGGDGPFIPAVAARALLRQDTLPVGAGPALGVVTLAQVEDAMSDLQITTARQIIPRLPIFPAVLGDDFNTLPQAVRATHDTVDYSRWAGRGQVVRGTSLWARIIGFCMGFPPAATDTSVSVTKEVTAQGETWERCFGRSVFKSHLATGPEGMTERFGPLTFQLGLKVSDQALHYPVRAGRLGWFRLPDWMLPVSQAREFVVDGVFHFDVAILAPVTKQPIVHYKGWLKPA